MNPKNATLLKSLLLLSLAFWPGLYASAQYCNTDLYWITGCTGDEIDGFETSGGTTNISNLGTGCIGNWDNYVYYSGMMHTATHGDVVNFTIVNNPSWTEAYKIWVDWNQDGDFDDAGERVFSGNVSGGATRTGSFTVPANASVGLTRMRVRGGSGFGFTNACDAELFGEAEDYDFFVSPSVSDAAIPGNVVAPLNFCQGSYAVQIIIQNIGNNPINNVQIAWKLDGVPQPTVNYTTTIPVITMTPGSNNATVTLGTVSFAPPSLSHTIEVTVLDPNGLTNNAPTGTNIRTYTMGAGLNGSYTVGGTTPDFPTVVDAANYLNTFGMCGPVTMNIRPGTYTGRVKLIDVLGSSTTNRITFKSQTENANDVSIEATTNFSTGTDYVFQLNNASDVSLKYLSIKGTGTSGGGRALDILGDISNDSIYSCKFNMISTGSWGTMNIGTQNGIYGSDNVFMNNTLTGGDYAMSFWGYQQNAVIQNNLALNAFASSFSLSDIYGLSLTDNQVNTTSTAGSFINTWHDGIAVNNCGDAVEITRNKVKITNGGAGIGSWGLYGNSWAPINIYNNEVIVDASQQFSSAYGINLSGAYLNIYNNSVHIPSTVTDAAGGNFSWSNDLNIYNNVFANTGGGPALFITDPTEPSILVDYNNIYTTGTKLVSSNSDDYDSLSQWRISSGKDMNSISYDPGFTTANDLHPDPANPASWSLNGRGIHMAGNTVDKDGAARIEDRANGVPDIGAYEFTPTAVPPAAKAIPAQPAKGITQVFTFGGDTVATISWKTTVPPPPSVMVRQYTGTVPPQFPVSNHMYFYTDVNTLYATYDLDANVYYKDPWMGTIPAENDLRIVKKEKPASAWVAYNDLANAANTDLNTISGNTFTSLGYFTGIENDAMHSAYIKPASTTVFCTGGAVTLTANGNPNTPFTYQWMRNGLIIPGATNQTYVATNAGDYSVEVTDISTNKAQSMEVAVTIVATPNAHVALSGPRRFCPGSSVDLIAQNSANQTYQWMHNGTDIPGATNPMYTASQAGSYELKVANIGCSNLSTPVSIIVGPVYATLGTDTSFCQSTSLILDAQNEGSKYLWNTGDTTQTITVNSVAGKYWVTIDAGPNCTAFDTIDVHIDPLPSLVGINYIKYGNTYKFEPGGMQNADNYLWIFGDGTTDTSRNLIHEYTGGVYKLKLVVFNGCGSDTAELELPLTVQDLTSNSTFELYPNPAKDNITLKVSGAAQFNDAVIVNSIGQIVERKMGANTKERTFDVHMLPTGHYFIRANTSDGKVISKPFQVLR